MKPYIVTLEEIADSRADGSRVASPGKKQQVAEFGYTSQEAADTARWRKQSMGGRFRVVFVEPPVIAQHHELIALELRARSEASGK